MPTSVKNSRRDRTARKISTGDGLSSRPDTTAGPGRSVSGRLPRDSQPVSGHVEGPGLSLPAGVAPSISYRWIVPGGKVAGPVSHPILDESDGKSSLSSVSGNSFRSPPPGGGVIAGLPELVGRIGEGNRQGAFQVCLSPLRVVKAALGNDSGIFGAGALARLTVPGEGEAG